MRYLLVLGIVASVSAAVAPPGDNCLRAIRDSARPGAVDCSSYLRTTVTPATVTVQATNTIYNTATETNTIPTTLTITEDVTTTITTSVPLLKRQHTDSPTNIPVYASPCSGAVRYSSACSQLGVIATVITVATPSLTVTVPEVLTKTETIDISIVEATKTQTNIATQYAIAQCLNLASSPVNYQTAGQLIYAGLGNSDFDSAASAEECCTACFNNELCFGFAYGNYDPANTKNGLTFSPQCYIYRLVTTTTCQAWLVAFGPDPFNLAPTGGIASFGYGRCSVTPW